MGYALTKKRRNSHRKALRRSKNWKIKRSYRTGRFHKKGKPIGTAHNPSLSIKGATGSIMHALPIAAGFVGAMYIAPRIQSKLPSWAQGKLGGLAVGLTTAAALYFVPKYGRALSTGALVLTAGALLTPVFNKAESVVSGTLMPAPVARTAIPAPAAKAGLADSTRDYWEREGIAFGNTNEYATAMGFTSGEDDDSQTL